MLGVLALSCALIVDLLHSFLFLPHGSQLSLELLVLDLKLIIELFHLLLELSVAWTAAIANSVRLCRLNQHTNTVWVLGFQRLFEKSALLLKLDNSFFVVPPSPRLKFKLIKLPLC